MRMTIRILCPALLGMLAGCASTPDTRSVAVAPAATVAVACTERSMTEQPCLASVRDTCSQPVVDTIHLVLARQDGGDPSFDYRATYRCPSQQRAMAPR
jgi:hypothetical protein